MQKTERIISRDAQVDSDAPRCWVCSAVMHEIHCKLICPHCGYTRDCSDP